MASTKADFIAKHLWGLDAMKQLAFCMGLLISFWLNNFQQVAIAGQDNQAITNKPLENTNAAFDRIATRSKIINSILAKRIDSILENCRSGSSSDAQQATKALAQLEEAYVKPLLSLYDCPEPETQLRAMDTFMQSAELARVQRALILVNPQQRKVLLELESAEPELFADFFSNNMDVRLQALKKIVQKESLSQICQPLVLLCMQHSSSSLRREAIMAAIEHKYCSDEIVDALMDSIAEPDDYNQFENNYEVKELALTALKEIHPPRAAP